MVTIAPAEQVDCTCIMTDEKYWFRYGGAVEPGSQWEYNPDCPEHGSKPLAFTLKITLGNEGMLSSADIAEALNRTADGLWGDDDSGLTVAGSTGAIRDVNGNTVGSWTVQ